MYIYISVYLSIYLYILFLLKWHSPPNKPGFINGHSAPWTRPIQRLRLSKQDAIFVDPVAINWSNGNNLTRQKWPKRLARSRQLPEINSHETAGSAREIHETESSDLKLVGLPYSSILEQQDILMLCRSRSLQVLKCWIFLVRTCNGYWYSQKGKESPSV